NFVGTCVRAVARRREVIERSVELIQRPGPCVTLVAHERLRDRERVSLALTGYPNDLAEQGGRMREAMRRQIATHLGLGMRAWRDLAEYLQHHGVVDDERT